MRKHLCALILFASACLISVTSASGNIAEPDLDVTEEAPILLRVDRHISILVNARYKDSVLSLPVFSTLSQLKVFVRFDKATETIDGYFISPDSTFHLDRRTGSLVYAGRTYSIPASQLVLTSEDIYLPALAFESIFGLKVTLDYRSLSALVESPRELPVVKEYRQEQARLRRNQSMASRYDHSIPIEHALFRPGVLDWQLAYYGKDARKSLAYNLWLGLGILGGSFEASANGFTNEAIRAIPWRWKYSMPESDILTQVQLGVLPPGTTILPSDSLLGMRLTNKPLARREEFGIYTLREITEPNWTVEVYLNDELIDFRVADASGEVTFDIPLSYGSSSLTLKYLGPWGEERSHEKLVRIPYYLLPAGSLEYAVTVGRLQSDTRSTAGEAMVQVGLTHRLTIGAGIAANRMTDAPAFNWEQLAPTAMAVASFRPFDELLLQCEYFGEYYTGAKVSYASPNGFTVEGGTKHFEAPKTNEQPNRRFGSLERQTQVSLSTPIRSGTFAASLFLGILDSKSWNSNPSTNATLRLGAPLFGTNVSLASTASAVRVNGFKVNALESALSFGLRLPLGMRLQPRVTFDWTTRSLRSIQSQLQANLGKDFFLTASIAQTIAHPKWNAPASTSAQIGVSFRQAFFEGSSTIANDVSGTTIGERARGAIIYNPSTSQVLFDNQSWLGKGGITVRPFYDENYNEIMEPNEHYLAPVEIRSTAGKVNRSSSGSTVMGLEGYARTVIENRPPPSNTNLGSSFLRYQVTAQPGMIREIMVPFYNVTEIAGTITFIDDRNTRPAAGLRVSIEQINTLQSDSDETRYNGSEANRPAVSVGDIITLSDGSFYTQQLKPGTYRIRPDPAQLEAIGMHPIPVWRDITLPALPEDLTNLNIDFTLASPYIQKAERTPTSEPFLR